jgi:outer membrane protein assembly factor BamE (lipoprotein component of BamABCDE complex)
MSFVLNRSLRLASACALAVALVACGNISHDIAKNGASAAELEWPRPADATPMHKAGTFPNLINLRQVKAGLNKQQVSDLISYPHFHEGAWNVREWNYLFNFREPGTDAVTVCQYKVIFDDEKIARSFYWEPASCADRLKPLPLAPIAAAPQEEARVLLTD